MPVPFSTRASHLLLVAGLGCLLLLASCRTGALRPHAPGEPLPRTGDEIMICGKLYHTGTPVVLWTDPGGYDAYRLHCHFTPARERPTNPVSDSAARFGSFRRHVPDDVMEQVKRDGWTVEGLGNWVDLFVVHYDACGTSQRCFEVLHDLRGLSVHFMLDLDGTIYQTLDVKERAWHAGSANDRSVGVEIANIGAYGSLDTPLKWYDHDARGWPYVTLPERFLPSGVRTPDFVAYPARPHLFIQEINGRHVVQFDFTDAQYVALTRLIATLCRVLPQIEPDYPRDADDRLRRDKLSPEELAAFSGVLGHWHVSSNKVDPGPAFDWDRVLTGVRELLAEE